MYSAGEGVKGLEQCYKLEGFDSQNLSNDFRWADVDRDGERASGEVYYKDEATKQAWACFRQLEGLTSGFQQAFPTLKTEFKWYLATGTERDSKGIAPSVFKLLSKSGLINKAYKSIRVDEMRGGLDVRAYKRGGGKTVQFNVKCAEDVACMTKVVDELEKKAE
ncbi:MAG: hypothetical protein HN337_06595 [Deltaproteobacteria bacterium]|jgi:hypothetical protein|nr:hypothetical protein [Deltaproteobacteria bacterium]